MNNHPGPYVPYIIKDGGNWTYQIRTLAPHNPASTIGKHIATINGALSPVGTMNLMAAAPEMRDLLEAAILRVELANAGGDKILSAWLNDAKAALAKADSDEEPKAEKK